MKLSIFVITSPLPPNSGSAVDIYNCLKALVRAGMKIQLFVWTDEPTMVDRQAFAEVCEELVLIPFRQDFSAATSGSLLHKVGVAAKKLLSLSPAVCELFALKEDEMKRIVDHIKAFCPDLFVAEGLQCAAAALAVRERYSPQITFLYHSKNREFKYNYDLAKNMPFSMKKAQFYCDAFRLLYFEPYLFLRSTATLQISYNDFVFWSRLGMGRQISFPPVAAVSSRTEVVTPVYDIVILSGWAASHKAAGLVWFLRHVKPRLPENLKIAVAGRGASDELKELCLQSGCIFLGEVADSNLVLRQGSILLNTVFGGSGVYVKMLDMLRAERPIVSTEDGITGLAPAVRDLVRLANTPESYAKAIMEALNSSVNSAAIESYLEKYSETECGRRFKEIVADIQAANPVSVESLH